MLVLYICILHSLPDMYYLCEFMVGLVSRPQSNISDWAIDLHVGFVMS